MACYINSYVLRDTNTVSVLMGGVCALACCVMVLMQSCYFLKPPELIKLIKDQIQMVQCGISAQLVATNQITKLTIDLSWFPNLFCLCTKNPM